MIFTNPEYLAKILEQAIYVLIGIFGGIISIIYAFIGGEKLVVLKSIFMVIMGGFIGWICGVITGENIVAGLGGALSMEIFTIIKKDGPELIKKKIKIFLNLK